MLCSKSDEKQYSPGAFERGPDDGAREGKMGGEDATEGWFDQVEVRLVLKFECKLLEFVFLEHYWKTLLTAESSRSLLSGRRRQW